MGLEMPVLWHLLFTQPWPFTDKNGRIIMKFHPLYTLTLVLCLSHMVITPAGAQAPVPSPCFEEYANTILSSFVSLTEQQIRAVERELVVLSATEEVKSADWDAMRSIMQTYQDSGLPGIVWFVLPNGNYYTVEKGLVGKNLSDRKYFPGLMSGRRMIGGLVVSKSTGRKSVIITVPVKQDGEVVGGLGVSVFLDVVSERIDDSLSLPGSMVFYALAPNGTTTLHRNTQLNFEDPREQGFESLRLAADKMLSNSEGEVTYEYAGNLRYAVYQTSALTGWRFAIAVNLGDIAPSAEE